MLAVVKMPHTKRNLFEIKGNIPKRLIKYLKKTYGNDFKVNDEEDDEELIDVFETEWYKNIKKQMTPGKAMKIYRQRDGLSQAQLGKKLGKISRQRISDMENGRRSISKEVAKNLAVIFDTGVENFI